MVNKTADCFNNTVFWLWKLVEKIYWKNGKQLNVEKNLMSVWQDRRAVAVSRSNFWFQSSFSQKDDEEKFNHSEKFAEKKAFAYGHFLFFFNCFVVLTFELSNINWKCSENIYMLTEHTYYSAVFEIFLNIITIYLLLNNN